ncbi:MazG-like family protein [Psychrobacillus sp. FSL H8-0510]|uniref:MazG-like family protein n=1 Tax=Psychrobacillus sp. FSL H8-0510 TaxID=2921394 RepID=UPI0030F5747E
MTYETTMVTVNTHILQERFRQNVKWGKQNHSNGRWLAILGEEFGEVCEAMQQGSIASKETDANNLYEELIHVAAVASAFAEQVLRDGITQG